MLLLQKLENQLHVELESADLTTYLVCAQHLLQVGTLCESDSVMSVTPAVSFMLVDVLCGCHTCGHHVPRPRTSHTPNRICGTARDCISDNGWKVFVPQAQITFRNCCLRSKLCYLGDMLKTVYSMSI